MNTNVNLVKLIRTSMRRAAKALPDSIFIWFYFYFIRRELLHLKHPSTFSEKIQWLKLYGNLPSYSMYVDKYEVREFVEKTIGTEYLINLLGVWDSPDEIVFEDLPKRFVLKVTHGSGYNYVCLDKSQIDEVEVRKTLSCWQKENFYAVSREPQYKNCKPRIICEKYLQNDEGELTDYKFFCFSGTPYMVQVDTERFVEHKRDLMGMDWDRLPITLEYQNSGKTLERPGNFSEMKKLAKKLAKEFPFVRVDLYSVKGKVYFGELTFTPGSGLETFTPKSMDKELGDLLNLNDYQMTQEEQYA